jgi:hypothetical protein
MSVNKQLLNARISYEKKHTGKVYNVLIIGMHIDIWIRNKTRSVSLKDLSI